MLSQLTINNLAITEHLSLEFEQGLSVLTGETGAGKSIIIDAIGLVLGDRADPSLIKANEKRADIIASFDLNALPDVSLWLKENELDSDDECIVKRSLHDNGRSKGFINAQPVPLGLLKQLGENLISIHGQNSHQLLLQSENQRVLLDEYAKLSPLNQQINEIYTQWKKKSDIYQTLISQADELEQKQQFLKFQLDELHAFSPIENEFEQLENEYKILSHSSQLLSQLQNIQQLLSENEQQNAESLLASANRSFEELLGFDQNLLPIHEMLTSALIQISEANNEISHYLNQVDENPARLNELEERLSQYHELSRKHQSEGHLLYSKYQQLEQEYESFSGSSENQQQLLNDIKSLEDNYQTLADKLSIKRAKASKQLGQEVEQNIQQLGLSQGLFTIDLVEHQTSEEELSVPQKNGKENIHFMIAANPGQKSGPIAKVASGGELSRISLAIQVVTAQYKSTPSLIFDEIDVGVGGKIAEMIGAKLAHLGKQSQIFCVTHQAQVAVHGNTHFLVEKSFTQDSTSSTIVELDKAQRIEELSRMLSGSDITDTTRLHATEMLQQAQVSSI